MITSLEGKLVTGLPTQAVIDVNGVGYEVFIPLVELRQAATGRATGAHSDSPWHVREDAHILYGFMTPAERDLFRLLVNNVTGIGPETGAGSAERNER